MRVAWAAGSLPSRGRQRPIRTRNDAFRRDTDWSPRSDCPDQLFRFPFVVALPADSSALFRLNCDTCPFVHRRISGWGNPPSEARMFWCQRFVGKSVKTVTKTIVRSPLWRRTFCRISGSRFSWILSMANLMKMYMTFQPKFGALTIIIWVHVLTNTVAVQRNSRWASISNGVGRFVPVKRLFDVRAWVEKFRLRFKCK